MMMKLEPGKLITLGVNDEPVYRFKDWNSESSKAFADGYTLLTRTWSEAAESIRAVLCALIDQQALINENRGRAKIYAHSG
ncbi:hypothetical protein, partial [Leifsonia sp. SIMBA_070]|uniref:hypothetical protein n=1 Tax=Leifsonia sp. SIMBA_070 TaxID=3085810 RepID=UPI00397D56C3